VVLAWSLACVGEEGWSPMTETLVGMSPLGKKAGKKAALPDEEQRAAVRKLVKAAHVRGEDLTGPDGRLTTITATVLESPLAGEITERLGFDKRSPPAYGGSGNIRNGTRFKTVLTEAGRARERLRGGLASLRGVC
jgi:hypothetical protein